MKLSRARKAIKTIKSSNLRRDFERIVTRIEKLAETNTELAGARLSSLMGLTFDLQHTLPATVRFSLVDGLFADAAKNNVPHQWERKEGFACGTDNLCSEEKEDSTCYRDTSGGTCVSR